MTSSHPRHCSQDSFSEDIDDDDIPQSTGSLENVVQVKVSFSGTSNNLSRSIAELQIISWLKYRFAPIQIQRAVQLNSSRSHPVQSTLCSTRYPFSSSQYSSVPFRLLSVALPPLSYRWSAQRCPSFLANLVLAVHRDVTKIAVAAAFSPNLFCGCPPETAGVGTTLVLIASVQPYVADHAYSGDLDSRRTMDKVDSTMSKITEQREIANEIAEAISYPTGTEADEEDLSTYHIATDAVMDEITSLLTMPPDNTFHAASQPSIICSAPPASLLVAFKAPHSFPALPLNHPWICASTKPSVRSVTDKSCLSDIQYSSSYNLKNPYLIPTPSPRRSSPALPNHPMIQAFPAARSTGLMPPCTIHS
ncbi:hypothetical protein P692DRAFT_201872172 [Suillus brevipes Sb2]|nr:hypothetical protein P692DRAFT_201872172 [Suillus brevipes Sb2]